MGLSKRLLSKTSVSDHAEKTFVSRLKYLCGAQFTSKLEGMLNDIGLANDESRKFTQHLRKHGIDFGFDFKVTLLTHGFWPSMKEEEPDLEISKPMKRAQLTFEQWYLKTHKRGGGQRKIQFLHSQGSVDLAREFAGRRITLQVSTIQAAVLLALNAMGKAKISLLLRILKVSPAEL